MEFIDIPTEQTTAVTDAVLCVVAAICAALAVKAGRRSDAAKGRIWTGVFGFLAVAGGLGAIAHGFAMSAKTNAILWMPLNLALGLTVALFVVGAVYDLRGFSLPRGFAPIMIVVGILFFAFTFVVPGSFLVFVAYEALAMLFALVVYINLSVRRKLPGAVLMAAGVLISIAAAAVQATGAVSFTLIWEFDHNGAFHLIQLPGLAALVLGIRKELASRRT